MLSVLSLPVRVLVLVALDLEGVLPGVGLGGKQDVPGGGGGGPADLWLASGLIKLRLRQSLASLIKCFSGGGSVLVRARIGRQPGAVSSWAPGRATATAVTGRPAARARETERESGKGLRLGVRTGRFGDLPQLARLPLRPLRDRLNLGQDARQVRGYARAGKVSTGEKKNSFGQKHCPTSIFYGPPLPPTSLGPDMWIQHEGYGGPESDGKGFQLFSIFIV